MVVDIVHNGHVLEQIKIRDLRAIERLDGSYIHITLLSEEGSHYCGPIYGTSMFAFYKHLAEKEEIDIGNNMHKF